MELDKVKETRNGREERVGDKREAGGRKGRHDVQNVPNGIKYQENV